MSKSADSSALESRGVDAAGVAASADIRMPESPTRDVGVAVGAGAGAIRVGGALEKEGAGMTVDMPAAEMAKVGL